MVLNFLPEQQNKEEDDFIKFLRNKFAQFAEPEEPIATARVTAPQPAPAEIVPISGAGITRQFLPREQYELLGVDPEQFLTGVRQPEPSILGKIDKTIIGVAQTPLTVGPVTMAAGEWAGLFGMGIAAVAVVTAGLPIAFSVLMAGAFMRNINKLSLQTKTPVNPQTVREVADYLARQVKPGFANSAKAIKEIFKPTAQGKFIPTPQATAKADAYAKGVVTRIMPEFTKTRTDLVIAGIKSGKYSDIIPPSVAAVGGVEARLGAPAEIRKTLPTEKQTVILKTVQEQAKKLGLDVEAVQGISPDEYWVAISARTGGKEALKEWLKTLPETTRKEIGMKIGGIDVVTGRVGVKKGMFAPFKNIEDAQRFLDTGDISAIASRIELRGEPMTPEAFAQMKAASDAQLARLKPVQDKIDVLQKKLDKLIEQEQEIKAIQDIDKWKAAREKNSKAQSKLRAEIGELGIQKIQPTRITPAPITPEVTPPPAEVPVVPEAVTPIPPPTAVERAIAPPEAVTPAPVQQVNAIQEQGRTAPKTVKPKDAKYAHVEKAAPDGPKPPIPPRPPTVKDRTPDDILGELADKTPIGERPDQALLRLYEAAVNSLNRRTNIVITKGDQKLKKLGIGVEKRGILVPKEKDKAILTELYNALHNPSKVETGEITVPKGYEVIYKELRGLADWTTASRLDFDPNAATLEDWFFRGWKPPEGMFETQRGQLGIQPRALRMPRVDATFQEMIDLGFEPLFWNPYQQWGYRHNLGEVYREQMNLIDYLKAMGNEFIRPDSGGALPVGWKIPRIGPAFEGKPILANDADGNPTVMFTRRWVAPTNIANTLENIFGRRPDIGKFVVGGKIVDPLALIDLVTFVPKRAKLLFSLFQQVDFATRAGGGSWAGMVDNLMAGKPIDAVKSLARYPQTVVTLIHANLSPGKRLSLAEQLDDTTPIIEGRPDINLKNITEAGISTIDITIFAKDMDKMMRIVADNTGIWAKAKGVADSFIDLESAMRRGLFNGWYPAAMITDIPNIAIMMVRDNPNATGAQINAMIAKEVNKKYSTIPPSQSVFQNTALREILRRIFFSVGESEGLLRQATGMFHGRHKRFWLKQNLGIAFFVLAVANIIHFLSTGEPLPKERYVPISKDNWGPLPYGYNAKFAAPTLPFRGRGDVELTLDLMGQMDTAFRILDPGSFISARSSVPIRATVNQISGTDFYGAPIDNVGPGGVASRLSQLIFDLFSPIGVGQIGAAALREAIPGELIPRGEERLGMLGLGIQATGLNIRAEGTRVLLDRHARESGFLKRDKTKVENWADLETHQKNKVLDNLKLVDELELRSQISVERGYPGAAGYFTLKELDKQRIDRGELLVTEFEQGRYLGTSEFPKEVTKLKAEIASRKSQVDEDFQLFQDNQELPEDPNKRALVEYYSIFDKAKRESETIDWELVEIWEAAYRTYWTPEQEAYVDDNTGLTKWGPKMQEYIDAQKVLSDSGYWDISEPNLYGKRQALRLSNPEIEVILLKWYGYKPAQTAIPRRTTDPFGRRRTSPFGRRGELIFK